MRRRSAPLGMDNFLSPLDTMFNFIPQGHEKALKHALYNALAILFMIICVSGVIAVFYILEPFIKPLLWAVLCGSVLYPLKHALADILKRWLEELDQSSTPLVFGMMVAPIQAVDAMSEWALCAALLRWKLILGFISSLVLLCVSYNYTPGIIVCFVRATFVTILLIADTIVNFLSTPIVATLIIAHLVAVGLWWYSPIRPVASSAEGDTKESKDDILHGRLRNFLRASATVVWLLTGGYLVGEGFLLKNEEYKSLRTPAFLSFFSFLTLGLISEYWESYSKTRINAKEGQSRAVDFSKWSIFLKGTTDEQSLSSRSSEEEEEEKQELLQGMTDSAVSLPPSESVTGQKEDESQKVKEESKASPELVAKQSGKEPESEQSQDRTPKTSKKICFAEDLQQGTENKEEEDTATKERPAILKVSNQSLGSVTLRDRTGTMGDSSLTSLAEAMIGGDMFRNTILLTKNRSGSKCFVIPIESIDSNAKKLSEAEEEGDPNLMSSYNFISGVTWACVFVQLLKNPWILQLLFLPLIVCVLHRTCWYFEVWSKLCHQVKPLTDVVYNWYEPRKDAIFPTAIKGLYKLMAKLNRKLTQILLGAVDGAASLVVMIGIITFGITAIVFFAVQSYGEGFHMLQVCGNVVNSTIMNNPELSAYLPEGMETMVDSTLNNAYVYGREGLVSLIRSLLGEESEARDRVESQVLELWDRVYQAWVMGSSGNSSNGPVVTDDAVLTSWDNLLDTVKKTPALTNFNAWSQFAQENLETVMSLVNSVWLLLKGNITLFITIFTTLLSVVFGGGSALFGFFISMIIIILIMHIIKCSKSLLFVVDVIKKVMMNIGTAKPLDSHLIHSGYVQFPSVKAHLYGIVTLITNSLPFLFFMDLWIDRHILGCIFEMQSIILYEFAFREIVFLTALFYLLNSSGKHYKPVEMLSVVSPAYGPRIGKAFQAAINGVFEASFKMALFYGMWTWFIHNLFQMQIVYIPTALASLLAAIPFLGVYWASLPAVLDLWLSQGKGIQAILIFLAILLPCSMVDTAIYKEIKSGGHPYLTGLSIAGGIFCLGVEGAIMGPMILCCFLVGLNLSSNFFKDSTSETVVPVHMRRMRRMDTVM